MAFPGFRFGIKSCCCNETPDPCVFASDNFNRADNTDVTTGSTCGWTETNGNWSIVSNKVRIATTFGRLTCATSNPDNAYTAFEVDVELANTSDVARLHIGALQVEFRGGASGFVRLVGSPNVQIDVSLPTSFRARLCVTNNTLRAEVLDTGDAVSRSISAPSNQTFSLGAGSPNGGGINFDNVVAKMVNPDCEECLGVPTCPACTDGGPQYWGVDLTGMSLVDSPSDLNCPFCDTAAAYYLCKFGSITGATCNWGYTEVPDCMGRCRPPDTPLQQANFGIGVFLEQSGGLYRMRVSFAITAGTDSGGCSIDATSHSWQNNFGDVTSLCDGPYTLTSAGATVDTHLCDGTFPTSITVDRIP